MAGNNLRMIADLLMMTNGQHKLSHEAEEDSLLHQQPICNSMAMNPNINFSIHASALKDGVSTCTVAFFTGLMNRFKGLEGRVSLHVYYEEKSL